ncbi:MAG: AzlC family ABC transporter permease [Cyanobacteria bacterium J06642_2]
MVGAAPFGVIFGTLGASSELSIAATLGMSAIVFAGSAQFIALGLIAAGTHGLSIVLTTFIVNLRHLLYSLALMPHVKSLPQQWKIPLAFWLTDEAFTVVSQRYRDEDDSPYKHWFYFGACFLFYVNWQLCTWLGVTAGRAIPDATEWGLDFAMTVTFIGMVIPYLTTRPMVIAAAIAGVTALATHSFPHQMGLIVAAITGVAAGVWAEKRMQA